MSDYKLKIDVGERVTLFRDLYGNVPLIDTHFEYKFDFDVGSNVEVNGVDLKVVEDKTKDDICKDCVLLTCSNYDGLPKKVQGYLCEKSLCINYLRKDGKSVHYEEVKDEF